MSENDSQKNQDQPTPPATAVEVRIEKILNQGDGLGRHDGQAVFVPLSAPGDLVRAQIIKQGRGFVQTTLTEVLEPGPGRREAPCPHYGQCGGCNLQHLEMEHQRRAKADIVLDCFQRLGKMDVSGYLQGPSATGEDLGYRNRIRVFSDPTGHYGLMRKGSHDVVALEKCLLLPPQFNDEILPWMRLLPPVEQVIIRIDGRGGWIAALFGPPQRMRVLKKILATLPVDEAPGPGCQGLLFNNRPIWGRDHLIHEVAGHKFRVSAQSFFQGNLAVTERAVAAVRGWIDELSAEGRLGTLLTDLFCGVGLFTLTLGDAFTRVVAIDSDPYGCRDAENNIRRDAAVRDRARVHKGRIDKVLAQLEDIGAEQWREAFCVLDPPRTGLGKDGLETINRMAPRHLAYMSCDPATMARDVAALTGSGYRILRLEVLDMFPQTSHIESLMFLERQD